MKHLRGSNITSGQHHTGQDSEDNWCGMQNRVKSSQKAAAYLARLANSMLWILWHTTGRSLSKEFSSAHAMHALVQTPFNKVVRNSI